MIWVLLAYSRDSDVISSISSASDIVFTPRDTMSNDITWQRCNAQGSVTGACLQNMAATTAYVLDRALVLGALEFKINIWRTDSGLYHISPQDNIRSNRRSYLASQLIVVHSIQKHTYCIDSPAKHTGTTKQYALTVNEGV